MSLNREDFKDKPEKCDECGLTPGSLIHSPAVDPWLEGADEVHPFQAGGAPEKEPAPPRRLKRCPWCDDMTGRCPTHGAGQIAGEPERADWGADANKRLEAGCLAPCPGAVDGRTKWDCWGCTREVVNDIVREALRGAAPSAPEGCESVFAEGAETWRCKGARGHGGLHFGNLPPRPSAPEGEIERLRKALRRVAEDGSFENVTAMCDFARAALEGR